MLSELAICLLYADVAYLVLQPISWKIHTTTIIRRFRNLQVDAYSKNPPAVCKRLFLFSRAQPLQATKEMNALCLK